MATKDLNAVARAAQRLEAARADLAEKIRVASESGESLADIAPYAGLSRSRVHELLKEARARRPDETGGQPSG